MASERYGHRPRPEPVSITDKRRLDPKTGQVRETPSVPVNVTPQGLASEGDTPGPDDDSTDTAPARDPVSELTADLQRVHAEYANYRRRVERDRRVVADTAKAAVLTELLEVLDDLDLARAHGDLEGPFATVANKLTDTLSRIGLTAFGDVGDRFDPALHEAMRHEGKEGHLTVDTVLRRGYRLGDRLLRNALVTVSDRVRPNRPGPPAGTVLEKGSCRAEPPTEPNLGRQPATPSRHRPI